jgi:hypothetical protein
MTIDPFSVENLRLPPSEIDKKSVTVPLRLQKRRKHFIKVPWTWHERLVEARHTATYKVAAQILYQYWKNNGEPFTLGNNALNGVSRWQKSRALAELEAFGLIAVERRKRKSPLVTVVV